MNIGNVKLGDYPLLLAPMEDVSDPPFRALCKEYGADLMFTEFISSEGLIRDAEKSIQKLDIYDYERPIGIQIFGSNMESMLQAADIVEAQQPEIIDINYGCPVKKVTRKGAGAGILLDLPKMQTLTEAIVKKASIPVTVKTRLGWDFGNIKILEVAQRLQDAGIQALTIHGRTRKQVYSGVANWDLIAKVRNHSSINIPIFGNGDINSPEKALEYKNKYPVDGMMIGRASIGCPWIFRDIKEYFKTGIIPPTPTITERVELIKRHLQYAQKWKGPKLGILETRRHYSGYLKGLKNIKHFRKQLVTTNSIEEIYDILYDIPKGF